jgi:hypothetical protein
MLPGGLRQIKGDGWHRRPWIYCKSDTEELSVD